MIEGQLNIYDMMNKKIKITKPIRLIEFFAGYGSQALALKYLGVLFEHWKICEWAVKSIQAYKDIHFTEDNNDYSKDMSIKEIKEYLLNKGISSNYNEPMNESQIKRLNEQQARTIYNNIKATHNLVNIQQVKGKDLEIIDKDRYCYITCYSFPCQDLSLAGKGKGMSDTSTRSGMLWEVERILYECKELGTLPQVLLMENVPQIHGKKNIDDFNKWQNSLESMGYKNYWKDLIATDYGIPQTRKRTFMISILGDYTYEFPKPIPLEKKLKDMLEDNVDEKYYLSDKQIKDIQSWNAYEKPLENMEKVNKTNISPTLTTRSGAYAAGMILIKNNTKKGYLEATIGDGIDLAQPNSETRRGRVQKESIQTLTTQNNLGVCVGTYQYAKSDNFMQGKDRLKLGKDTSDTLQTSPKEGVVFKPKVLGGIGEKDSNNGTQWKQQNRIYDDKLAITVTTCCNPYYKVDTIGNYSPSNHNASRIVNNECSAPTVMENHGTITATQTSDLRIRKLTPKECFRLMGVKDEDYEKCAKNQSDSSLYHLAGDSIVTNCLCAIFKELL